MHTAAPARGRLRRSITVLAFEEWNLASKTRNELAYNLGIDLGTSSVKAILAAEDGSEIRAAMSPCAVEHPLPGHAEADPGLWWSAVVQAVSSLDTAGANIRGIGISVLYPALVLFDKDMQPLRPAVLYCDQRAAAESEELLARYGEARARALTGSAFPAGTSAVTSLMWLGRHEPEVLERMVRVGLANTFLVHKLTGEFTVDFSNASISGLYDTGRNEWSAELCDIAGVPPVALPGVIAADAEAGRLSADAARQLGLPAGLPVAAGAGDTVCSALGIGVADESELFVSCGSTNCFAGLSTRPDFDNGLLNTSHLDAHTWINIGSTSASGAAIQWFINTHLEPGDYERFFDLCRASAPGAGGVVFLPYLSGERTPLYDPRAKAVFFGMTLSTSLPDLARSVAEGICFADRHILETFERNGRKIERVLAAGGGSRNKLMRRIRTDVTGREIAFCSFSDVAALGAALLGGVAGGCYADWRQAAAAARNAGGFMLSKPDMTAHRAYDNAYRVFKQLYPQVKDLFA